MRRYLTHFFGVTILGLVVVISFNWVVDPYAIYNSPRIYGFNVDKPAISKQEPLYKTATATQGRWHSIIFGTSRTAVGLDPLHPAFNGQMTFNAAISGQGIKATRRLFEEIAAQGDLKQAVLGLDFFVFNAYWSNTTIPTFTPLDRLKITIQASTLTDSRYTVSRQGKLQGADIFLADGRRMWLNSDGYRNSARRSDKAFLEDRYLPVPYFKYSFDASGLDTLDDFRQLIAFAHAQNIDLRLFISPSHARQWEVMAAVGLWSKWEEWKRRLVAINEEEAIKTNRPTFALWDFSGYNSVTSEPFPPSSDKTAQMKWYWESCHYKKEAGDLVLDRVFNYHDKGREIPVDFGVLLNSTMLDGYLANIREARKTWRIKFPEDAAEVEKLASEVAEWRIKQIKQGKN